MKLSWSKVRDADGYDVFFVKCGKGNKYKRIATVAAPTRTCEISGLKNAKTFRAYVKAWKKVKGSKTYIGKASPAVHAITGGYNKKWCDAKAVTIKKTAITLVKGKSSTIKATVTGVKKGKKVLRHAKLLRYYSSDRNVAKVNSRGRITAVGDGTCTIYAMANNGVKAGVEVTVVTEPTKIAFKKAKYSVKKGKKLNLAKQVKLSPGGVTSALTWSGSDPTVATVSSKGVVKGMKKGTVTITVQTANGKTAKTVVKVK